MEFPYIPISYVIADVRAELKRMNQNGEIQEEDVINYAIECIREIGGANYSKDNAVVVHINNHIGNLPKDLYLIDELWLCEDQPCVQKIGGIWFSEEGFHYRPSQMLFPGDAFTGSKFCSNFHKYPTPGLNDPTYIVKHPNQIRCSLSKAVIGITYLALPKETSKGYLMQDEINSIKAVKAFIKIKLLEEKWILTEVPDYIYQNIKRDYEVSLDQAQAVMKFDDPANDKAKGYQQDHRYDGFSLR